MGNTKAFPLGGGGGGAAASVPFSGVTTGTNTALLEMTGQVNISGPDATTNVEIGSVANDANAGTGGTSVVIGNGAGNAGNSTGVLAIGSLAAISGLSTDSISIGRAATITAVTNSIALGAGATITGASGIAIGSASSSAGIGCAIGTSSVAAANEFVCGSTGAGSFVINNVYFGKGKTSTTATAYAINGTGGSGSDNAGGGLSLAGGIATGTGAGGNVALRTSARSTTSSTPQTLVDRHLAVAGTKTLTAAAATGVVRIGVPQGLTGPVGVTIFYAVRASDGTDFQLRRGSVHIAAVNKTGTETAVISAASEVLDGSVLAQSSASTLTYALTVASNAADTIDFEINAVSGLAETTLDVCYTVIRDHGVGTITPL